MTEFESSIDRARRRDAEDPLAPFRERFFFPQTSDGTEVIYFCGNSLGLQPRAVRDYLDIELDDWAKLGVEGHFEGTNPWYDYHEFFEEGVSEIVGAKPHEVCVMGSLTANLHFLMVSFYRPTAERYKIVMEKKAFPSDQYAIQSQVEFHGYDPDDAIVEIAPREGTAIIEEEDIEAYLAEHGDSVALVLFGGVNYYSGQAFDFARISRAAHDAGARVGFDLAHAAGNLRLRLHDDDVDFAAWCSYKYMNSGPGSVAGIFVHDRFADSPELPRFAGWWGNDPKTRFEMTDTFYPQRGAGGWQLSNAPVLTMAAHKASVDIFAEAGMDRLRAKTVELTEYLLWLIDQMPSDRYEVITPRDPARRGAQISIRTLFDGANLFADLQAAGVVCDFRKPDVIRVAPAPLYCTFEDVFRFSELLRRTT